MGRITCDGNVLIHTSIISGGPAGAAVDALTKDERRHCALRD